MKITFTPNQPFGQANPMLYGHFLEHFHRQVYGGVYDPTSPFADEDGFRTDVLEAIRDIKPAIIRWPGGCYVSAYHWHYGVGKDRPATFLKSAQILGIDPAETIFIDDSLPNVEGAKKAGMEAYHFTSPADLAAYFRTLGILN